MNPSFFAKLTDEELGEWNLLTQRLERLNAIALDYSNATNLLRAELEQVKQSKADMEADFREGFDRHAREIREATEGAVRDRNRLSHICEQLLPIVVDWLDTLSAFSDAALVPLMVQRRKAAVELMRLMTPFAT